MRFNDATWAQIRAAAPDGSTWLAANAGSGKTRVLTDRVARLLLEGVPPAHILCLTYTKAAATEMQNRLFKRLGGWAMLDDDALRDELAQLGIDARMSEQDLQDARTLFAIAIETPGGMRIQTIHSFCATLLRRFPLEARVSPQFKEVEDRAAERLRMDLLDQMSDGPQAALVADIAPYISGDIAEFLEAVCGERDRLTEGLDQAAIFASYGLTPGLTDTDIVAQVFLGGEIEALQGLVPALRTSGATDQKLAEKLASLTGQSLADLAILESVFLTGGAAKDPFTAKLGAVPTKAFRKQNDISAIDPMLDALMLRVQDAREMRLALAAAQRDWALYRFSASFLPAYAQAKQTRGWLDFDDLITRARDLLNDKTVAEWVLYRLDGGIDHILVDEAQDTSPMQWQVIERLAQEITSGEGARANTRRTIFVVGDKKQSIYSFQGADPAEFDRMRDDFAGRLQHTNAPLSAMELQYSFRSAEPILRLVDNTFAGAAPSGFVPEQMHKAFDLEMPGRVDLWPVVDPVKDEPDGEWFQPVDRVAQTHHAVQLANRIAHFIAQTIHDRAPMPVKDNNIWKARSVDAGDFLILVRSRSRLFHEIIRACKQQGLPIAGADRLKVMAELAVRDVVAVLQFLATPEDDLSLACALRSPLFGVSEQDLFDLAHRRDGKYLWPALRDRGEAFPQVMTVLNDLRAQTDFLRPYDLIERLLTLHDGRPRLIGRLGEEAQDGIDALLVQALAYEQTEIPSLTGFLQWVQTDNLEIKRAPDSAGSTLRVMTVHGAKGLEAPIVILPDCAKRPNTHKNQLMKDQGGVLWKQPEHAQPLRQRDALEQAKTRIAQENDRLLYVAMTRAESWLIVCAAGELSKDATDWYSQVAQGMEQSGAVQASYDFADAGVGDGLQLLHGTWQGLPWQTAAPPDTIAADLPDTMPGPAPKAEPALKTRAPSDLGGAKALAGAAGDETEVAKARGTHIHLLLEHLPSVPVADHPQLASALLGDAPDQTALLAEAQSVLANPALARFFDPGALHEVPVTATLPGIGRLHGIIDCLIIDDQTVTAVDYKSNRIVPKTPSDVPEGLLRQMGSYAAALAQIYPDHRIETGLVWTADASYMGLPADLVTQALARTATS